jgi:transposase
MHPTIIGLDLAKHVFQVHGIDVAGKAVIRKKLRRSELKTFFAKLRPAWSVWKPAVPRIIGVAS